MALSLVLGCIGLGVAFASPASALKHTWTCYSFSTQICKDVYEFHSWVQVASETPNVTTSYLCSSASTEAGNVRSGAGGAGTCVSGSRYYSYCLAGSTPLSRGNANWAYGAIGNQYLIGRSWTPADSACG